MIYELFGWFERASKIRKLKEVDLKKIFRKSRRRYVAKYGKSPSILVVRMDEHKEWMSNMGIDVEQVDKNLASNHFMLAYIEE